MEIAKDAMIEITFPQQLFGAKRHRTGRAVKHFPVLRTNERVAVAQFHEKSRGRRRFVPSIGKSCR